MAVSHYISQEMTDMAEAYKTGGLGRLAVKVSELDQNYAPYSNISATSSTILNNAGVMFLAQISSDLLTSLLDYTLVQKWKTGAIVLNDWHRIPQAIGEAKESAIYVNYYTAPDGTGLSIAEYQLYLKAMSAAMLGRNVMIGGKNRDIIRKIDVYHKKRTGEQKPFSRLLLHAHLDHSDFMKYQNKVIGAATKSGASEIRFPGEVRWGLDVDQCIKNHQKLQGNELLLRLTICVVGVLWPEKRFELSSFALFRVFNWDQVHVSESIGSHLINSYAGYGGFNFSTTGVTISSAARASPATWDHIARQYQDVMVFSSIAMQSTLGITFVAKAHVKFQQLTKELKLALDQVEEHGGLTMDRVMLEDIAQGLVTVLDTPDAMTEECHKELCGLKWRVEVMAEAATERLPDV